MIGEWGQTSLNPFRYSSQYEDSESGLYYYGYRYYQPETGRWMSRDPIGEAGGLNLYGMVANDPVNQVDVFGLSPSADQVKDCLKNAAFGALDFFAEGWLYAAGFIAKYIVPNFLISNEEADAFVAKGEAVFDSIWTALGADVDSAAFEAGHAIGLGVETALLASTGAGLLIAGGKAIAKKGMKASMKAGFKAAKGAAKNATNKGKALVNRAESSYQSARSTATRASNGVRRALSSADASFTSFGQGAYAKMLTARARLSNYKSQSITLGKRAYSGSSNSVKTAKVGKNKGLPRGITYEGRVQRYASTKYADSAWDFTAHNIGSNYRYTGSGRGGVYSSTSKEALMGEFNKYKPEGDVSFLHRDVKIDNVLDLTDPAVRKQLGVSLEDLVKEGDGGYIVPQAIGDLSQGRYNGILVPSATAPGTTNLVILPH